VFDLNLMDVWDENGYLVHTMDMMHVMDVCGCVDMDIYGYVDATRFFVCGDGDGDGHVWL
jgi:hypothetical protein